MYMMSVQLPMLVADMMSKLTFRKSFFTHV